MDKILTLKERILQYIEYKKIKKELFFKTIGFSYSNFKGSNKKSEIGSDKIVKILTIYDDINPEWLLTGEGPMLKEQKDSKEVIVTTNKSDEKALPLLPVSAIAGFGSGELHVKEMDIEQWYTLPDFPSADFLITISGDSMLPTYKPGDIAICKRITNIYNIVWGRLYVIYSNDMGALFKRIYPTDNTDYLILRSDNAESYPDIRILKTDIINISLVLGIIRKD